MTVRNFGVIAAMSLLAATSAHADPADGDIVNQILPTLPSRPGDPMPPPPPPAPVPAPTPAPVAIAPLPAPAPTPPRAVAPTPIAPTSAAVSTTAPAAVARPMPAPVAAAAPAPPAAPPRALTPATAPAVTAAAPPSNGDIIAQSMQDMPEPVRPEAFIPWTGMYFGPNIGYGTTHGGTASNCFNSVTNNPTGCVLVGDTPFNTRGIAGGGQVGYMMPVHLADGAPVMVGIEADVEDSGLSGSHTLDGPFAFSGFPGAVCSPCSYTASQSLDWFGTVRLRIGFPVDNFLIYATGGAIVGGVRTSQSLSFAGSPGYVVTNNKQTLGGPTVGGGVEVLLPNSTSAKLEALYYDLGTSSSVTVPQNGFAGNFFTRKTFGFRGALIRFGLNFRLGDIGAY